MPSKVVYIKGKMHVNARFRYRFYPNPEQADLLVRTFGCVRFVYNKARAAREQAWSERKENVSFIKTNSMLTAWKKEENLSWLNDVSSVPLQQALRHLDSAYRNFFNYKKGYPRFKSKNSKQSAEFTKSGFKWSPGFIKLAKMNDPLKVSWSRNLPSPPSTVTVIRESDGRWFVTFFVISDVAELPTEKNSVGVDLGLINFVTLSTGEKINNPRFLEKKNRKVRKLQRGLSKKKKGSNNRKKAKIKLARAYSKATDARRDFHHKLSSRLVNENQVICLETLSINGMLKAKLMSRSIADAGWGEFVHQLQYKSWWNGRTIVKIDRWYPSTKTCSDCGFIQTLSLSDRDWVCDNCNTSHDRDVNAAKNILAAGLAVIACGEDVRLNALRRSEQSSLKQESVSQGSEILSLNKRVHVKH